MSDTLPLRHEVLILNLQKSLAHLGLATDEATRWWNEDLPISDQGTPAQHSPAQSLRVRSNTTDSTSYRQAGNIRIAVHASILEAAIHLSGTFRISITPRAISLVRSIACRVENKKLLAGFSSVIAAVVCADAAAAALGTDRFIKDDVIEKLGLQQNSIRLAYNELWIVRDQLHDIFFRRGGDIDLLPIPVTRTGQPDVKAISRALGGSAIPIAKMEPRVAKYQSRKSPLRNVFFPGSPGWPLQASDTLTTDVAEPSLDNK